jgi:hypothetical protein
VKQTYLGLLWRFVASEAGLLTPSWLKDVL